MDQQRKYAILFAGTILAARNLNETGSKPCPARECAISDAIASAELILRRIAERNDLLRRVVSAIERSGNVFREVILDLALLNGRERAAWQETVAAVDFDALADRFPQERHRFPAAAAAFHERIHCL